MSKKLPKHFKKPAKKLPRNLNNFFQIFQKTCQKISKNLPKNSQLNGLNRSFKFDNVYLDLVSFWIISTESFSSPENKVNFII